MPAHCKAHRHELSGETALVGSRILLLQPLNEPFEFEMERTAKKLGPVIRFTQRITFDNWIGCLIVAAQGHYPIYLTIRRESD